VPIVVRRPLRAASLLTAVLACNSPASDPTTSTTADTTTTDGETTAPATTQGETADPLPTTTGDPTTTDTTGSSSSTGPDPTTTTSTTTTPADTTTTGDTGESSTTGESSDTGTSTDETGEGTTSTATSETTGTSTTGAQDGLGELSGDCGLIDAMELTSPDPFVFTGAIDFGAVGYDYAMLTPGGQQIYDEGNLNPGSLYSEIVAYEVLARCEMAALLKTEATIVYTDPMGKKTDLLVEMDGLKIGVSVVRAVGFPQDDPYTPAQAEVIIKKKLEDILVSSANVAPEDAWEKQILSVVAYGPMHVDSVLTAYAGLDPAIKADTILVVTATDGDDAFIY
jgi:hypothetical protein